MLITALPTHLRNDAGVGAIVGARIYPQIIPQHVYDEATKQPCLVYQMQSNFRQPLFCGTDSVVQQPVQIDCYAPAYPQAHQLADATRAALIDFSGTMGSVAVKKVLIDAEFDALDEEPGLFRVTQFWTVWFAES